MQSSYLWINDLRTHYLHWGSASSGQTVLLLHGLASNARIWDGVARQLMDVGLAPIAPDARGHGLTDKPDGDYGLETFLRDLLVFMDAAHLEQPFLVGHSWGGLLALEYAARFPIGPRAPAGLVLVDGGFTQMDQFPGATWELMRERLTPPKLAGTPVEVFLSMVGATSQKWQPDDHAIQAILANFEISTDEAIYPHLSLEHHLQILRSIWEYQTHARFERVRCPVLMIPASSPSPLSAEETAFLELKRKGVMQAQLKISDLRVHWMDETIHDIPLQRPVELASLMAEFVAEVMERR
ncbi:MAG: alpha/beta hydrolase [Anaerolineales bacterium]|jgi:pimeloyl-ACP methyl ester carboxylesterase